MKLFFSIAFVLLCSLASAQTEFVKQASLRLDEALVKKDSVALKQLLHQDLSYGHSNAWVETKSDVIKDLFNGKLSYKKIKSKEHEWKAGKDWATLRTKTEIEYVLDGKDGSLDLHVLQVWVKTNKGWQLLARQSTKK